MSQPFKVQLSRNALLVCDFHAHLATTEIIGFLGGKWDPASKCTLAFERFMLTLTALLISEAFPCKSVATAEDTVNVEMDPSSELEVREVIKNSGLHVVGWYHSHPVFQPDPSIRGTC